MPRLLLVLGVSYRKNESHCGSAASPFAWRAARTVSSGTRSCRGALNWNTVTPLIGFFLTNQVNSPLCHLIWDAKYEDMPEVCVWNEERRIWTERKNVYWSDGLDPSQQQQDLLFEVLLKHVAGSKSYVDLQITNPGGCPHPTFKDACLALNLCESDNKWIECMSEVVSVTTPSGLRTLLCNFPLN
ncbi:LOW QUALITY PROTEIN: hypothetical protein ACHAWF_002993 [Thalassiosira exigua]